MGMAAHVESSGYRLSVKVREIPEGTARKQVLGRGNFAERDEHRRIIKGTASKNAKAAAVRWCETKGWLVRDDNEADAAVIWQFAKWFVQSRHNGTNSSE